MGKKKSDRQKLKDAILKHCALRNKEYKKGYGDFSHPKTGKTVTCSEVQWYIQRDLEKLLDRFFPEISEENITQ